MSGFGPEVLALDLAAETRRITEFVRHAVADRLRRKGAVVAISGGIDSAVTAALCVQALGKERVFGLFLPEADSSPESTALGQELARTLGIAAELFDIRQTLTALGCYAERDAAVRSVVPAYGPGCRFKIVLPDLLRDEGYRVYSVVVRFPDGREIKQRLTVEAYLRIVAATNFKQRVRKMREYFQADRLQYAVAGTPNRLEHDQGFFVKLGDGAADLKPIAHLYKSQVFALAEHLGVPDSIRRRKPTTDTYSLEQGQDEFYFSLGYREMDLCLFAHDHRVPAREVAPVLGVTETQVERVFRDIEDKRRAAAYLHAQALILDTSS